MLSTFLVRDWRTGQTRTSLRRAVVRRHGVRLPKRYRRKPWAVGTARRPCIEEVQRSRLQCASGSRPAAWIGRRPGGWLRRYLGLTRLAWLAASVLRQQHSQLTGSRLHTGRASPINSMLHLGLQRQPLLRSDRRAGHGTRRQQPRQDARRGRARCLTPRVRHESRAARAAGPGKLRTEHRALNGSTIRDTGDANRAADAGPPVSSARPVYHDALVSVHLLRCPLGRRTWSTLGDPTARPGCDRAITSAHCCNAAEPAGSPRIDASEAPRSAIAPPRRGMFVWLGNSVIARLNLAAPQLFV